MAFMQRDSRAEETHETLRGGSVLEGACHYGFEECVQLDVNQTKALDMRRGVHGSDSLSEVFITRTRAPVSN